MKRFNVKIAQTDSFYVKSSKTGKTYLVAPVNQQNCRIKAKTNALNAKVRKIHLLKQHESTLDFISAVD